MATDNEDESPVGQTVPPDWKAPQPERQGTERVAYEAGQQFGKARSGLDNRYADLEAARKNKYDNDQQRSMRGTSAPKSGSAGASAAGTATSAGLKSASSGSGSGVGASGPKPSAGTAGAGGAKGGTGKGVNIRQGIDQAKDQLKQAGDQAGDNKAGQGINKAVQAVDKVEQAVDKTATGLMVLIYVILSWLVLVSSITFLFFTGFFGAIVAVFPLISPKYAYKIIVWILYAVGVGEVIDMAVDADNIKLNSTEKLIVGMNTIVVLVAWLMIFGSMVIIFTYSACKTATTGVTGVLVTVGTVGSDTVLGTNFGEARKFCEKFTAGVEGFVSGGNSNLPPGGAAKNVEQYAPLLRQIAQENSVEYCALEALMRKESGGDRYAYSTVYYSGDKNIGTGPSGSINPGNSPPYYGLSFSGQGHAIGLLQIMVYNDGRSWQNSTTPSRSGGEFGSPGKYLTISDLIDENTNIRAGTAYYIGKLRGAGGDPVKAYSNYQGDSRYVNPQTLTVFSEYYNQCKTR